MNITVLCSAADLDDRYTAPAREFATLLGAGGHTMVWGGSDVGLMKVMADGVEEAGGRLSLEENRPGPLRRAQYG